MEFLLLTVAMCLLLGECLTAGVFSLTSNVIRKEEAIKLEVTVVVNGALYIKLN